MIEPLTLAALDTPLSTTPLPGFASYAPYFKMTMVAGQSILAELLYDVDTTGTPDVMEHVTITFDQWLASKTPGNYFSPFTLEANQTGFMRLTLLTGTLGLVIGTRITNVVTKV